MQLYNWVDERCAAEQVNQRSLPSRCSSDPEEKKMGEWIKKQRAGAKHSQVKIMDAERRALLEAVNGWTWAQEENTSKRFSDTCPNCKYILEQLS